MDPAASSSSVPRRRRRPSGPCASSTGGGARQRRRPRRKAAVATVPVLNSPAVEDLEAAVAALPVLDSPAVEDLEVVGEAKTPALKRKRSTKGNTTIWSRSFAESSKTRAACDSRVTLSTRSNKPRFSDSQKKFYFITEEIFLCTAGSMMINQVCAGQLRHLARVYRRRENKPITLSQLVVEFRKCSGMGRIWFKLTGGEGDGCGLLLCTRVVTDYNVCKLSSALKRSQKSGKFKAEWSNEDGDGCGYDEASTILKKLSDESSTEEIRAQVKSAFKHAARCDQYTGGCVLLFEGSPNSQWSLGMRSRTFQD